ncbi:MAG: hypothetical protein JST79_13100 [Acidobacteria bacterium]|jgi:hypothetical protein|nr:hypothetical protein [Acidobacteriota bacterium]
MARWLRWAAERLPHGWACSECDWNFPLPDLIADPEAKAAYDRLAAGKFQSHDCAQHASAKSWMDEGLVERARKLVMRGFKPRDAVDIAIQEILLERRNDPVAEKRLRQEAESFLQRVREGLI